MQKRGNIYHQNAYYVPQVRTLKTAVIVRQKAKLIETKQFDQAYVQIGDKSQ